MSSCAYGNPLRLDIALVTTVLRCVVIVELLEITTVDQVITHTSGVDGGLLKPSQIQARPQKLLR